MVGLGFPQGVVGRFQVVPADPGSGFARPVLAAGAVLCRTIWFRLGMAFK